MILVEEGQTPIILCLPHSGTDVPNAIEKRLNATGRLQADLAWRLERVFDFHKELDVTVLRSSISRYVIDLDRDPETPISAAFDPARALCPATTLDGKRIYQEDEEPGPTEVEQRALLFHTPFHTALSHQIERLQREHGTVIVLDCQSMRSHIKGVTDAGLPLASIGSKAGASCDPDLRSLVVGSFKGQQGFTVGVDEQTQGGFIAESFGKPDQGVHVLTLLLAQRSYLRHESPPFEPDKTRLTRLRTILSEAVTRVIDWTAMGSAPASDPSPSASDEHDDPEPPPGETDEGAAPEQPHKDASTDEAERADIIPVDPITLTKVSRSQTGKVEDGPVAPLLVAE